MRLPTLGLINLAIFGLFMITAGIGSIVPQIVKDRLPEQFRPLWQRVLGTPDEEWNIVGEGLAVASQWIIGLTELAAGFIALAALVSVPRRRTLAQLGLGLATGLFGAFMIVLFFLHEAALPKWNQYPAILVWLAATWFLLEYEAGRMAAGASAA